MGHGDEAGEPAPDRGSFEGTADWYDRKMGERGDRTHQYVLLPALLRAAGDLAGTRALDLGCGGGVASRALAEAGARVLGLDLSRTLVGRAVAREETEPLGIRYLVADAARLPVRSASFDLVAAHMVLMDAADGAGLLRESGRALRPGGRFVATLLHPCFAPPLAADWAEQEIAGEPRQVRRLWRYRPAYAAAERLGRDQPIPITRFHRPLEWYGTQLRAAGLLIDTLDEPPPDASLAERRPASFARERAIPSFLVIGARKQGRT